MQKVLLVHFLEASFVSKSFLEILSHFLLVPVSHKDIQARLALLPLNLKTHGILSISGLFVEI